MRSAWVKVAVATAVVVGLAPVVRAEAPPEREQRPLVVTGHVQQPWQYVRQGHTARDAALLARYDRFAAQGIDAALLTQALADSVSTGSSSTTRPPTAFLTDGGRLREVHALLEQRFVPGKNGDVVQVVAREALTGRPLWTRTDALPLGTAEFAFAARVGSGGVILVRDRFEKQDGTLRTTLIALSGNGKTAWTRALPPEKVFGGDSPSPEEELGLSFGFDMTYTGILFDERLRRGSPDLLLISEQMSFSYDELGRETTSGSLRFRAISQSNGAMRDLAGAASSSDGLVLGGPVGDQDGDGYDELATVVAGRGHRATVRRARDGGVVWDRSDLAIPGAGWLDPVGHLTGTRAGGRPVEDLTLSTWPDPGAVGFDVVLPVTEQEVQDPTAASHGTVTLLAARTGRTVWSKPGDWSVEVLRAGVPAVAVATDLSSTSSTTTTASLRLEAFTRAGASKWVRTWSISEPADSSQGYALSFGDAGATDDLDGDGGMEAGVALVIQTDSHTRESDHLVQARDGHDMKDAVSGLLWAGVTRHGHDRVRVSAAPSGVTVRVLRGRDSKVLFSRLVPGSRGMQAPMAWGDPEFRDTCSDVLVMAGSGTRTFVAVLAPSGAPRWQLNRVGKDLRPGTPRVMRVPAHRC